jgi:hypothetical protein
MPYVGLSLPTDPRRIKVDSSRTGEYASMPDYHAQILFRSASEGVAAERNGGVLKC